MKFPFRYIPTVLVVFFVGIMIFYYRNDSVILNYGSVANMDDEGFPSRKFNKTYFQLHIGYQFRNSYNNVDYNGYPFDKLWNKYLQKFGLLNVDNKDDAKILDSDPVYVTAFSDNHYQEANSMMHYLSKRLNGTKRLYLYDIGLRWVVYWYLLNRERRIYRTTEKWIELVVSIIQLT